MNNTTLREMWANKNAFEEEMSRKCLEKTKETAYVKLFKKNNYLVVLKRTIGYGYTMSGMLVEKTVKYYIEVWDYETGIKKNKTKEDYKNRYLTKAIEGDFKQMSRVYEKTLGELKQISNWLY